MSETTSTNIEIPEVVAVSEFAAKLGIPVTNVIGELMKNGVMATINEQIDFDTAAIIGSDLGFEVVAASKEDDGPAPRERLKLAEGEGVVRPPVVAVMGHVDHGKTSLLDAIRHADVAAGEAGGITQHIGAYQVKRNDRWITFLDTPGHEAFSAIRAHGARMTDVAIIVVAADDGVKPQTKEAIKHAQDAGVQLVIAINKIDKEGANADKVRQELSEMELISEEWGGKTVMVEVSAKTGKNIDKLLDLVLLVTDLEDLRADRDAHSQGFVIESHLDPGRGPVATLLVLNGTLNVGDYIVCAGAYCKIRSLDDYRGKRIKAADPGMPAVVSGFKSVPAFGDQFQEVANEKAAREAVVKSNRQDSIKSMVKVKKIGFEELSNAITAGKVKELNVVVKADVQGSLESLTESLNNLRNDEVAVKIVGSGLGEISESDITLAKTAGALLFGFNVSMGSAVKQLANREQVNVQLYKVIYELLDDLRDMLSQMLVPEVIDTVVGELNVLGVFKTTKTAVVCGGEVTSGKLVPKLDLRIKRGGEVIGTGKLDNLQREKQEAKEIFAGDQCGMNVSTTTPIELGDTLEFFTTESKARTFSV
jgi:translation initiation factor IF-2